MPDVLGSQAALAGSSGMLPGALPQATQGRNREPEGHQPARTLPLPRMQAPWPIHNDLRYQHSRMLSSEYPIRLATHYLSWK